MGDSYPHVGIVILNWNGHLDTVECLESVLKSDYPNFNVILIDNKSELDSVNYIFDWMEGKIKHVKTAFPEYVHPTIPKPVQYQQVRHNSEKSNLGEVLESVKNPVNKSVLFVLNSENDGFARANNLGFKLSLQLFNSKYVFALNNDTVIRPDAITKMVEVLENNPECGAVTAAIYEYQNPAKISNLGGKLTFWGRRKYFQESVDAPLLKVTFATGCALMIRVQQNDPENSFFSEKYFFGEEDYEYGLRMKKQRIPLYCVTGAKVYHKVSVAAEKLFVKNKFKIFIYFLNRIVNMRDYFPKPFWRIWMIGFILSTSAWLYRNTDMEFREIFKFISYLYQFGSRKRDVQKETVMQIKEMVFAQ